ncbi:MAG: hypothetical protein R6U62_05615 [Bacteroidales bacterium]
MFKHNRRRFLRTLALMPAAAVTGDLLLKGGFAHAGVSETNHTMRTSYTPKYVALHESGELKKRADILYDKMRRCHICPRECGADRLSGERGNCSANATLEISSANPHFGEENELVGDNGSGTVFFANCSLLCVFCINYEISHYGQGREYNTSELANMMLGLQRIGCHNINVVTPTHYAPQILRALEHATSNGLRLPLAYNTCGWEKKEILEILDGVVDIYLADFKYDDPDAAAKYSNGASSYPEITKEALLEMHRQVGVAKPTAGSDIIHQGLMVRHLVMPENVAKSDQVVQWIANHLPKDTYLNIMSQYTPMYKAHDYPKISRRIYQSEYQQVVSAAREAGLTNLRLQMQ